MAHTFDLSLCIIGVFSVTFSMAIIYGVFSASNLIAPSVVTVIGPQLSMFFSGLLYRSEHKHYVKFIDIPSEIKNTRKMYRFCLLYVGEVSLNHGLRDSQIQLPLL